LDNDFFSAIILHNLLFIYNEMGLRNEAELLCVQSLDKYIEKFGEDIPIIGILYISLASLCYEANKLQSAKVYAEKSLQLCRNLDLNYILVERAEYTLILIHIAFGNIERANDILKNLEIEQDNTTFIPASEIVDIFEVEIALKSGNIRKVNDWVKLNNFDNLKGEIAGFKKEFLTYCRYLILEKKYTEAENFLLKLVECLEKEGRYRILIVVYILLALVFKTLDNDEKSMNALVEAVKIAEKGKYIRAFFNEEKDTITLLSKIRKESPDFIGRIIRESKRFLRMTEEDFKELDDIETLSKRELEIISLISHGYSNKDIADRLFISTGTVKWHINNIFSKMDVKNRTQAVFKARDLHLIQ